MRHLHTVSANISLAAEHQAVFLTAYWAAPMEARRDTILAQ